jgi:N-acetylneuraminic acid mutarotase
MDGPVCGDSPCAAVIPIISSPGFPTRTGMGISLSRPLSASPQEYDLIDPDIEIEWSTGSHLPAPVCRGASGLIGNKIYLFGGQPSAAPVHYVYDIENDSWSTGGSPLPVYGSNIEGVVHGEKLYVFGGHTFVSDTMRSYDPGTNSWSFTTSPYPDGRYECCKYGAGSWPIHRKLGWKDPPR